DHAAIDLAAHEVGIDDPSRRERADQAGDADLTQIRIDLDLGEHRAMRMHGVVRLRRRVRSALAAGLALREAGAADYVSVALPARFVVATEQAAVAGDDAGVSRPEQRRALVAGREIGEFSDHGCARIVDGPAGGRGVGRAAGDAGVRQVGGAGLELDLFEVKPEAIGRDLGERGPGALAHVVGANFHYACAVASHHRARL